MFYKFLKKEILKKHILYEDSKERDSKETDSKETDCKAILKEMSTVFYTPFHLSVSYKQNYNPKFLQLQ